MSERSSRLLILSLPMLWGGNVGGWAIVDVLAGAPAAAQFLKISAIATSLLFSIQAALYFCAKGRLSLQLAFFSVGGLSLVWFMLCLILPVFWISSLHGIVKISVASVSVALFAINYWVGLHKFDESWSRKKPDISEYFDLRSATLDWDRIVKSLRLSVSVFPPGMPKLIEVLLSVTLIVSMLVGLNLRKVYPTFSVFAWGIPSIVIAAAIFQMLAINLAQARMVAQIESTLGVKISAGQSSRAHRKRKRR